jgi:RNA polymerase sigma-70 factor (ECF subfamily)
MNTMTALTQEQSAFAAEHHDLVYAFLRRRGYSDDDYYDVVIFGYLAAVQNYFEREDLHAYAFSTIAFKRMRGVLNNHFTAEGRRRRIAEIVPFDSTMAGAAADTGKIVLLQAVRERLERRLTPKQREILRLLSEGYSQVEIAGMYRVTSAAIWGELVRARECIRTFTPDWRELIAA